jgi:hypothetical protein
MTRAARYAYAFFAWAFVLAVVAQVFFIGMALFGDRSFVEVHRGFGWIVHLMPILTLAAAALARAGRHHWGWALALAAVVFVVPILVLLRDSLPAAAALHPVGATIAFWLGVVVARNALGALRVDAPEGEAPTGTATA